VSNGSNALVMTRIVKLSEIDSITELNNIVGETILTTTSPSTVTLSDIINVTGGDFHAIGGVDDRIPQDDSEVPDDITIGPGGHVNPAALPANILYDTSIDTEFELNTINPNVVFESELKKTGSEIMLTINSNVLSVGTSDYNILVDTESSSPLDYIDGIDYSTGSIGDKLIIRPFNDSRTVVIRNNSNIHIGSDKTLDSQYDVIILMCIAPGNSSTSEWVQLSFSDNGV
jgi:hypothetical protein